MPLVWTLLLNVPLGMAAWWVARSGFRQPAGLPRVLASAVLAWTWATLGMEVLGTAGLLTRGPLLAWVALGLLFGGWLRWKNRQDGVEAVAVREPWGWEATLAVGLVLWASLVLAVQSLVGPVKVVSDGPIYHLYFAARWWKAGRLFLVAAPFGENAATYFPAVGDLWFTWLMVGWGGDRLAKIGQAPFLLAAALASFGMARRLGAGVGASAVAAAWFVGSMPLLLFSFEANVDSILVAGYLLSAYFFLRYALGDGEIGTLALGGLAAGGTLGTKPTAVVFVPVLIALAGLAVLVRGHGTDRHKRRALLVLAATPMVMAGYWYGRDVLLTGNPLYPLQVRALGRVILPGWYAPDVMRLSYFYLPVDDFRSLGDLVLAVLDPREAPAWVLALAGAWAWGRSRPALAGWVVGVSALAVLDLALFWFLIPYRTQQRFMFPALGLAAVPLARTFDRWRPLGALGVVLLAVHLMTPQVWPFASASGEPPWDLSARIPNNFSGLIFVPYSGSILRAVLADSGMVVPALMNLGLGLVALSIAWGLSRPRSRAGMVGIGLGVVALAAVVVVSVGRNDPRRAFYPDFPEYVRGWLELDLHVGPGGARIAYTGTNIPYYLLGPGLRNEVRYINVDAHRDWQMHDYHRDARSRGEGSWPDPRPGWDRAHPDYAAWLDNLRAEGIQLLVIARVNPEEGAHNVADARGFPIERQWAESHPETFEPLYGVRERDPQFRIYHVRPGHPSAPEAAFAPVR